MLESFVVIVLVLFFNYVCCVDEAATATDAAVQITTINDLQCLSELPISQLLKIKKSLQEMSSFKYGDANLNNLTDYSTRIGSSGNISDGYLFDRFYRNDNLTALPLTGDIQNKVGYDDDNWVEEKTSKVQKIFQISVTALAFLAFGGYLLCMIVQAIKSKGTTYYHPALLPMTTADAATSQITYKRRPARVKRHGTKNATKLDYENQFMAAGPSPDEMYNILVMAAEGYVNLKHI